MDEGGKMEVPEDELKPVHESVWVAEGELEPIKEEVGHNELRDKIAEIGRCEGRHVEVEYLVDNLKLDVVWKKTCSANLGWAFEVQLGGNLFEALTKLKHAWDIWNCRPFLVIMDKYVEQAKSLIEGSFHEMKDEARLVE